MDGLMTWAPTSMRTSGFASTRSKNYSRMPSLLTLKARISCGSTFEHMALDLKRFRPQKVKAELLSPMAWTSAHSTKGLCDSTSRYLDRSCLTQ